MTPERMIRAAEYLEGAAANIYEQTAYANGKWAADVAAQHEKARHNKMLALAAELREHAESEK